MTIFKLPDLGEGLPDAEISKWHVKVGDTVELDQSLVSMETAKALVEVPSPFAGKIVKLFGGEGDVISTGSPLVEFDTKEQIQNEQKSGTVAGRIEEGNTIIPEESSAISSAISSKNVKATPAVRALALKLGVDLNIIIPSGPNGSITMMDVENASKTLNEAGPLELLKGARRMMAQVMIQSHQEVVPVTVMDDARLFNWQNNEDITVRIIKAIVAATKEEPALNGWFESKTLGRRLIKEVHLGLAVDAKEGLFVPVIRNAEAYDDVKLRNRIDELKKQVFDRTISPSDLKGATFTLSNFGKFAGRYANPIIVPPMISILAVGKLQKEVQVLNDKPEICVTLPLSLSFDHRAVTGGEASRFLKKLIESLEA